MSQESTAPDMAEIACLYAAGALADAERHEFEQRLARGDPAATAAWREWSPLVARLAEAVGSAAPPADVRNGLLRRIATESAGAAARDYFIRRDAEGAWDDVGIPGVRRRTLFVDRRRNVQTFLLRIDPGCEIMVHPHRDAEECFVLQGELQTCGTVLRVGDYLRAEAGSVHPASRSDGGCMLLVTAGVEDEPKS